jgi:hypothetical protein
VKELHFVVSPGQNRFFLELAEAICKELMPFQVKGVIADEFAPRQGVVHVLLPPHEYFLVEGVERWPDSATLSRTIFICAEQVETPFFEENVRLAPSAGAVFDINRAAVREFRRRGVTAEHFQLGYSSSWDRFDANAGRDIDVLFMGCYTPRRARYLATYGSLLTERRSRLIVSDNSAANSAASSNFLADEDKWRLLSRAKILVNVHQGQAPYFEWLRVAEALSNGCVVVSEHSTDFEPLIPGRHCFFGAPASLDLIAHAVLDDPGRFEKTSRRAREFLQTQLPLARSVDRLLEVATFLDRPEMRPSSSSPRLRRRLPSPSRRERDEATQIRASDADSAALREAVKNLTLDVREVRRDLERLRREQTDQPMPDSVVDFTTKAYEAAKPSVSVVVSLYNYERYIAAALDSVAASSHEAFEIVIVDDASTDGSRTVARRWLEGHEHLPATLVRHPVNLGLPHARNTAIAQARGEYSMILDADNSLYPRCIERLVNEIEADGGTFAYGILECFNARGPVGLVSFFPWSPERLAHGNYIDAQALVRTSFLHDRSGYTTDVRLYGWEDYDLWCSVAEAGLRGTFVPEIVGRYRVASTSMLALTNLSTEAATAVLQDRYPTLFAAA